jgi:hypothetical protein
MHTHVQQQQLGLCSRRGVSIHMSAQQDKHSLMATYRAQLSYMRRSACGVLKQVCTTLDLW